MLQITRHDIDRAMKAARSAHSAAERSRGKVEHTTQQLTQSATIAAGAFAAGVVKGKYGALMLPGNIPATAAAGVALHIGAFMNVAGKYDEYLHNFADGLLASYVGALGAGVGAKMGGTHTGTMLSGGYSHGTRPHAGLSAGQRPLTRQELARMARGVG